MRMYFLLAAVLFTASTQAAQPLLPKGSEISFQFKQEGVPMKGGFSRYSGSLDLNEAKPQASSVQIRIDTGSISAGGGEADTYAVMPDWFDTGKFPQATFVSESMKPLGNGRWEAHGALSIKGHARETVVPFTAKTLADGSTELTGTFEVKRGDYAVGEGEWSAFDIVANEVVVSFRVLFAK